MDNLVYWIWLSLCCTPGTGTFHNLIAHFDDAEEIYRADMKEISECIGYKTSDRSKIAEKDLTKAKEVYDFCKKFSVGVVTYNDDAFPSLLRDIAEPPVLLYYRGKLPDFDRGFCVAAVGTRSLSEYGRKNTFKISYDLACAGATIVSGMAIGIDSVASAGALSAGRPTVAILGSGIDICYPPQHLTLAREIVKSGCIMTEYPPKTPPAKQNFPIRNRIISGICAATIVFEGRERSGSLITARYAKDQERTVYALPGNVGSKSSEVTNLLIKNGAKPVTSAEDVIRDFESLYPGVLNPFNLQDKAPIKVIDALTRYGVCATTPSDDVFVPYSKASYAPKPEYTPVNQSPSVDEVSFSGPQQPTTVSFDKEALRLYKKIPLEGECDIEDLVEEGKNLRDVMKLLLKLEMGKFVVMLPGEKVARKTK